MHNLKASIQITLSHIKRMQHIDDISGGKLMMIRETARHMRWSDINCEAGRLLKRFEEQD